MTIESHDVIRHRVEQLWETGLPKGSKTGWPDVDALYTVGMHQWTLITGTPNSGKSEWLDALMVNLARQEDWKFFIYSPENYPLELHHSKILEKYIGKPFDAGPTERMDIEDVREGEMWMEGKFMFCKPTHPSMSSILEEVCNLSSSAKSYKTGIVIDPWNYLEHYRTAGYSETEYVSETLSRVIDHMRSNYVHLWLIAHPAKQMQLKDGSYPVPTPRDVSGSAHFWNKADNCITIWRDQKQGAQEVDIHVQKVRFKHMGRQGKATLRYDRVTGRYSSISAPPRIADYYYAEK